MRSKHLQLLTTKRGDPAILYLPKPLLRFGYGSLLILAMLGNLVAQELPPPSAPNATDLPDSGQAPLNPHAPVNSQDSNTPLLPQQQMGNPNCRSPPPPGTRNPRNLRRPPSIPRGTNDLSQIATNNALTQAFSQQAVSGYLSEPGIGYSRAPIEQVRLGPFDLKVALSMNVVSNDNLLAGESGQSGQSGQKISDTSFGVTPAILLEYGTQEGQKGYVSVVYAPTLTRFFSPDSPEHHQPKCCA